MEFKCILCKSAFTRVIADIHRGRTKYCSMACYHKHKSVKAIRRVETVLRNDRKQCQMCNRTRRLRFFHKSKNTLDGYSTYCGECRVTQNRESNTTMLLSVNRERFLNQRKNRNLMRTFNITLDEYNRMLSSQNGVCKICKEPPKVKKLHVDHCHTTNKVRGLLCHRCNIGLGNFRDNPMFLSEAISYLS